MKLRYLSNARLPTEKAHGIQIMNMCAAFKTAGADVELVAPGRRNGTAGDPFEYYNIPRTFSLRKLPVLDLTILARILGKYAYLLLEWSFARAALADAREHPADIYYHRGEFTFIQFARAGLPSVFEMHTVPKNIARYREAFEKCIAIIVISHGIYNDLITAGIPAEKIIIAPDGVDLKRFAGLRDQTEARIRLSLPLDTRIALYTGQLFPWKGVDTLIEAAASLENGYEVLIVGGGAGRETELRQKAKSLHSRVMFTGQVRHEEIPSYLTAADVVVIPNSGKERIGSHHTSPLKLFEAMAAGKAIIASDLPSLREILDTTCAQLVPPDDAPALAKALQSLLSDVITQKKLGATARDRVKTFDWTSRAAQILDAIRRLDRSV